MERKVIYSGKIQPGISKGENCLEIINIINSYKIKKEMKQMLFLAVMKIIPAYKKNKDILFHLESFKNSKKIYPKYSKSKYIQSTIDMVNSLSEENFEKYINNVIEFVKVNNVEFKFDE